MTKYKADIADTTASLLSLPDDLEGLVKQVGGVTEVGSNEQKKLEPPSQAEKKPQSTSEKKPKTRAKKKERPKLNVEGDDLWNSFVSGCDEEETISKVVGRNGNASWCMVDKTILNAMRRDMQQWAKAMRLHYKTMYVRPVDGQPIIFCGYKFGRGYVHLTRRTKKRYVKARHRERSMGSYKGIIEVADTKELKKRVQYQDNRTMNEKIRRPFAGRPMKIETMEGIPHTIVNMKEKPSRQKDSESYFHIQAIADGLGLVVYSTGSTKICEYLKTKSIAGLPLRDMKIVHDWSGFYYEGTVYTDAEEEEMIRRQFNIPRT